MTENGNELWLKRNPKQTLENLPVIETTEYESIKSVIIEKFVGFT